MAYHRLHSSNSSNNFVFAATFVSIEFTLKIVLSDAFVCFMIENVTTFNFLPAIFSRFTLVELLSPVTVISVFPVSRYLF